MRRGLACEGRRLPFPIEVVAFGDEEGSRFPAAMLCSRAMAGTLTDVPAMADADGVTLAEALAGFGTAPERLAEARHAPALAYLEAHIEQGPVLEAEGLPLGIVTGIAAQRRLRIGLRGKAGHAGTTAMRLRRDALAAAAEACSRSSGSGARDRTIWSPPSARSRRGRAHQCHPRACQLLARRARARSGAA